MNILESMKRIIPGRAASAGTGRPAVQEAGDGGRVTLRDGTTIDLSRREDRRRARRIVIDLQRQTDALVKRDLAGWRQAHQLAIQRAQMLKSPAHILRAQGRRMISILFSRQIGQQVL